MKTYEIEILHEPSGAYLSYTVETDEENPDFYEMFIKEISVIVLDEEVEGYGDEEQ